MPKFSKPHIYFIRHNLRFKFYFYNFGFLTKTFMRFCMHLISAVKILSFPDIYNCYGSVMQIGRSLNFMLGRLDTRISHDYYSCIIS